MMVGAVLTQCDCGACLSNLPAYPASTLIKGISASNDMTYINYEGNAPGTTVGPIMIRQLIFGTGFEPCYNQIGKEFGLTGPLQVSDFNQWNPVGNGVPFNLNPPYFVTTGIHSRTEASVRWQKGAETVQSTTGGYSRPNSSIILVSTGIPIKRNVYDFTLVSGPTGFNNKPDFSTDTYTDFIACCSTSTNTYASVTGGTENINRNISSSDFNQTTYGTIKLKYAGLTDDICYGFTINFANNPANNSKIWIASVSNGSITLTSSTGDVAGPYSGTLNSVASSLQTHTTWFSSVALNSNLVYSSGNTNALVSDMPNWTSPPFQRGVNGTSMSIPLVFSGAFSNPSTYSSGFYLSDDTPFFSNSFNGIGTENEFKTYLEQPRYAKKSSFINTKNSTQGLYYIDEYDSWLRESEGTKWNISSGVSTHTFNISVSGLSFSNETYNMTYKSNCYTVSGGGGNVTYDPDGGDFECDNGNINGPDPFCPSNQEWLALSDGGDLMTTPLEAGISDCTGALVDPPCGGGISSSGSRCICGEGSINPSSWGSRTATATQKLTGTWRLVPT